jgi:hypothetical protein
MKEWQNEFLEVFSSSLALLPFLLSFYLFIFDRVSSLASNW